MVIWKSLVHQFIQRNEAFRNESLDVEMKIFTSSSKIKVYKIFSHKTIKSVLLEAEIFKKLNVFPKTINFFCSGEKLMFDSNKIVVKYNSTKVLKSPFI